MPQAQPEQAQPKAPVSVFPKAPKPQPTAMPAQPTAPVPPGTAPSASRRVIRPLPCGAVSDGSSDNPSGNVTIPDDGN